MRKIIPKGTTVRVRTTNGGETVARLSHAYLPSYDAVVEYDRPENSRTPSWTIISAHRITSIEIVS